MTIGLRVAKVGKSIDDDVEDLVIDVPDNSPPKVHDDGTGTFVVTVNGDTETINHGLGYIPFVLVYIEESEGSDNRYLLNTSLPGILIPFYFTVDNDDVIITANGVGDFSGSFDYYYYIFLDEIWVKE